MSDSATASSASASDPSASPPPIIDRELLFGNPDRTMARISPDGRHISYLAPANGVLNVWVAPADELTAARPVTNDTGRGIRMYSWPYSGRHLLYLQDAGGDENWRIYSVDLASGDTRDLTPFDEVQAQIEGLSPDHPDEILIGLNNRNPQLHDLHRVNLTTGEMSLVLENEGFIGFVTDRSFAVRYAAQMQPDGTIDYLRRSSADDNDGVAGWVPFAHVGVDDTLTTRPLGLDATGDTLYMVESRGRNTAAFTAVDAGDPNGGEPEAATILAADDRADASGTMMHPVTQAVEAVSFTYAREEWTVLDQRIQADLDYLQTVANGEVEVVDRTLDDSVWIVAYTMDDGPVRYYRYDRASADEEADSQVGEPSTEFLFTSRASLEDVTLTNMHAEVIQARDGLDMVCYYTLPSWLAVSGPGSARPTAPLPTVLLVHGGPWARDDWGYNPIHQLLANRGYAVVSVNFRSSTGFGKEFLNAGNLEWGAKMHDDLLDTVDWAVEAGIADRDRVAIMGGSYGGYATLAGLTFTPEVFACGVDIVGPSNLITLLDSVPEYWRPMIEMMYTRVGNPTTEDGAALLTDRSPLHHVDNIQRPLLIGQGANDPRVKQAESDQIVDAMTAKGIPVTYVLYPDEGHGFARPDNSLSFFAIAEVFLSQHLNNDRYQPLPDAFDGSSVAVPAGADGVPGLPEALQT